jgi:hypothetical protein
MSTSIPTLATFANIKYTPEHACPTQTIYLNDNFQVWGLKDFYDFAFNKVAI